MPILQYQSACFEMIRPINYQIWFIILIGNFGSDPIEEDDLDSEGSEGTCIQVYCMHDSYALYPVLLILS